MKEKKTMIKKSAFVICLMVLLIIGCKEETKHTFYKFEIGQIVKTKVSNTKGQVINRRDWHYKFNTVVYLYDVRFPTVTGTTKTYGIIRNMREFELFAINKRIINKTKRN